MVFITIAKVLGALIPLASKIAKAMHKNSPGGKKILPEELLNVFLEEADPTLERLNALAKTKQG